jgi:hypothetical protein
MAKLLLAALAAMALAGCAGRTYDDGYYNGRDRYYGERYASPPAYSGDRDRYDDRSRYDERWRDDRDRY